MSLLSDAEMGALRDVAESAMVTTGMILRGVREETDDGWVMTWPTTGPSVTGMLYSTPSPVITEVAGVMALVNTYQFRVPYATDIQSADHLVIGSETYTVEDTTFEDSYQVWVRCSLRRAE